jgi:serine/threonine-protein kinase
MPIKPTYSSYSNLGTAYLFLNRYSEAAEALKKAVDLNPSDHEVWRNLADSYSVVPKLASQAPGAYRRALELANKRLQVDPNDDAAISAVALYEAHLGQEAAARAAILKALKYAPSNANVVFTSALIYEMMGHRAEALSAIESAHKLGYPLYAINGDPELIDLRRDGRFGAWLKTIR